MKEKATYSKERNAKRVKASDEAVRSKGRRTTTKRKGSKKRKKKKGYVAIAIIISIAIICVVYLAYGFLYYSNRFLPGTLINNVDCSNITIEEASTALNDRLNSYVLEIQKNGEIVDSMKAENVGLSFNTNFSTRLNALADSQNKVLWLTKYFTNSSNISLSDVLTLNEDTYNSYIVESVGYNLPTTIENKEKSIEFKDGKFNVGDTVYGDEIDKEAYKLKVKEALLNLNDSIELNEADCYTKPEKEDGVNYDEICLKANSILNYGSLNINVDGLNTDLVKEIAEAALVVDNNNVTFNKDTISAAITKISDKYNTYGGTTKFKTSHGTVVDVEGGDYGNILTTTGLSDKAVNAFLNGKNENITLKYTQNVLKEGVTGIGNTYVEIDLTNQYVYVYKDGNLVAESPCVTGLANTARATPQGVYMLKNKMMDVPLVGSNYVTPVKYWMPFNGGIGLHDAVWQSKFGGEMYKTRGSHGCINLPMDKAEEIYNQVVVNMPVVCYYHERLSEFQAVDSTGKVMGQYRSLTANERAMLNNVKNGRAAGDGAVLDSVTEVTTTEVVTEGNNNDVILDQLITPSAVE